MSIKVVASLNVREIVTASRGLWMHAKGGQSWFGKDNFPFFSVIKQRYSLCRPTKREVGLGYSCSRV